MNIITTERTRNEYKVGKSIIANISSALKSVKKKRNHDARKTVQVITASTSGGNIYYERKTKSLAKSLDISQR